MSTIEPVIHRVTLPVTDEQIITIHNGGEVLSVAPSRDGRSDVIDLWFTTYPTEEPGRRPIYIAGTGHPRPRGKFIGTVVTPQGLVWHAFAGDPIFRAEVSS
jgi:streptogramin lyase